MAEDFYTRESVMEMLGISQGTLYNKCLKLGITEQYQVIESRPRRVFTRKQVDAIRAICKPKGKKASR